MFALKCIGDAAKDNDLWRLLIGDIALAGECALNGVIGVPIILFKTNIITAKIIISIFYQYYTPAFEMDLISIQPEVMIS